MSIRAVHRNSTHRVGNKTISFALQRRVTKHLDRMEISVKVCVGAAIAAWIVTVVLLGVSLADYIPHYIPLSSFAFGISLIVIAKAIESCRSPIAKRYNIDLKSYDAPSKPLPSKSGKGKQTQKNKRK
jgi:hypothetical protein